MSASSAQDQPVRVNIPPDEQVDAWALGSVIFAIAIMIMGGLFQMTMGLGVLLENGFFVSDSDYAYNFNPTIWGWLHLGGGALVLLAGFYVFTGATWARLVGIGAALLGAAIVFPAIPLYPFWALLIIAIDVVVIWALSVHAGDFTSDF